MKILFLFLFYFLTDKNFADSVQIIQNSDTIIQLDSNFGEWQKCIENCEANQGYWTKYEVPSKGEALAGVEIFWLRKNFKILKINNSDHFVLDLGAISDKDKTYLDGVLIGSCGDFLKKEAECYDKIRVYEIPSYLIKQNHVHEIKIQIKRYFPDEIGINQYHTYIGTSKQIYANEFFSELGKLIFLVIYATVGFYFLFIFLFRVKETDYLLFGLFSLLVVSYQFLRTQIKYYIPIEFIHLKQLEYFVFTLMIPFFTHFIRTYFKISMSKIIFILTLLSFAIAVSFLFHNNLIYFDMINKNLVQPIGFIWISYLFHFIYIALKKKYHDAKLIFFSVILLFVSVVLDIITDRGYFSFPRTFGFTFFFFIMSIALILAHKFVRLNHEVEELNFSLEKKVELRTQELNQSMSKIAEIKNQQDGDYFLTSLLLNPLTRNINKSDYVKTEFYSKQKKVFEFRNKKYEIGGDISIATNLNLNNRKYLVFVNGDAMGKSIQGAGGALVMGVVFNTILNRSHLATFKNRTPEKWLKDSFLELQRVFESFDGTMFLSCVIGLLDEETGFLYYINAEHPWTILFRNGISSFIEKEHTTRKLGVFENEKLFHVKTMNLKKGDILILGSDGRDDIQIGFMDNARIINEDETIFLSIVKESKGDLEEIIKKLSDSGEFTDDCSLIRIEYIGPAVSQNKVYLNEALNKIFPTYQDFKQNNFLENVKFMKTIYKLNPQNEVVNKQLGIFYFKRRDYLIALKHINLYTNKRPEDTSMLYLESITTKKCGNFEKAIDIGEQIYLRVPKLYKNIKNLIELYNITNKKERVEELKLKLKEIGEDTLKNKLSSLV
jgi:hypothetical protein